MRAEGKEAIGRCNGLYAYAALDTAKQRLLLVRDRFGVKPLYLAHHEGDLWFASELRALLAAGVPAEVDRDALRYAAGGGYLTGPGQWLTGVRQLLPGQVATVDVASGEVATRSWFEPADVVDPEFARELAAEPRGRLVDRLEETLRTAVRRRLMSDVPLGTMCSGGMDSSLITAFARDEQPGIRAYNASVLDQPEVDENPYAQQVATVLGVELRTVPTTAESWRAGFVEAVVHNEQPLVHESSIPMAAIAGLAHGDDVKVLLSGEGADELLGGYEWLHRPEYRDLAATRRWERLARSVRRDLQRRRRARDPGADADPREFAHRRAVHDRALRAYRHHRGAPRRLEAALLSDLRVYLPHLLNRQDKNTMQRSIETRVPFLDPDVVALAVNLPIEARVRPERKGVLRDLAARVLPAEIARRPKVGFGFDIDRYVEPALRPEFLADGVLREALGEPEEAWRERVGRLRGQRRMLALSAEILVRVMVQGAAPEAVEQELWT